MATWIGRSWEAIASPPDASLDRLTDYAHIYARIASNKLEFGRDRDRNRVWVMKEDVAIWPASEGFRTNSWMRRHPAPLGVLSRFPMRDNRH
jgi:hypothetical protein